MCFLSDEMNSNMSFKGHDLNFKNLGGGGGDIVVCQHYVWIYRSKNLSDKPTTFLEGPPPTMIPTHLATQTVRAGWGRVCLHCSSCAMRFLVTWWRGLKDFQWNSEEKRLLYSKSRDRNEIEGETTLCFMHVQYRDIDVWPVILENLEIHLNRQDLMYSVHGYLVSAIG